MQVSIRQINGGDAIQITALSHQLGYPMTVEQTKENIRAILENKDHDAFVAVYDEKIAGWIGVSHAIQLESIPFCEIHGLVVDENFRKMGIGKLLIEKAKDWARERKLDTIKLRCNVKRTETHLFYQHLGFIETKQQKNFEIKIR